MSMPASYSEEVGPWTLRAASELMRRSVEEVIARRTHALEANGYETLAARLLATETAEAVNARPE